MKAKKKRSSTKAQIRAEKERERRIATVIFIALVLIIILFSAYFGYQILSSFSPSEEATLPEPTLQFKPENQNPLLKAAVVDQLSLTFPNKIFMEEAANILVDANYTVDYFSGEKVTVEFYRNLPTHGYKLIILRVHSTTGGYPFVSLFTSEPYSSSKYVYEQLTDKLSPVAYSHEEASKGIGYFGVNPPFVASSMKGTFQNTIIIMMGCEGLNNTKMAQAFIEKGAEAYIGWNKGVSASHTDTATISLLQHLITEKQTIKQAIDSTMKEVGTDPTYNSQLAYYPLEAGEKTIED